MPTTESDLRAVGSGGNVVGIQQDFTGEVAWVNSIGERQSLGRAVKRVFDLGMASVLLLISAPFIAIIAAVVAVTSKGGALFVQDRVGKDGRTFRLYKFRTMRVGTFEEVMSNPELRAEYEANNYKLAETDSHITPVGGFLRKSSLDELPQLWNVVKGDMSLVGIRPLVPAELAERPPVDRALYCTARPGLTGLWQVGGRSEIIGSDRLALDRDYIEDWSLFNDFKILIRTPLAVLRVHRAK